MVIYKFSCILQSDYCPTQLAMEPGLGNGDNGYENQNDVGKLKLERYFPKA